MGLKNLEERGCSKRKEVRVDREGIARTRRGVRRWPAAAALLTVGVSYIALSGYVTFGPRVWLPGFMSVLLVPLLVAHAKGHYRLARRIGFVLLVVTTASVVLRVFFLISTISARGASASSVLVDAILIWVSTVVTFAVWYWEIDGGGPSERTAGTHTSEDFLFPQMDRNDGERAIGWSPGFLDYLFVAFTTSS